MKGRPPADPAEHMARLAGFNACIKPTGKYELGNITFREDAPVDAAQIALFAGAARDLNRQLGDPTAIR